MASGHRTPSFQIANSNIADLEVAPEQDEEPAPEAAYTTIQNQTFAEPPASRLAPIDPPRSEPISDPAILSYGRPPRPAVRTDSLATATLSGPFNELSLDTDSRAATSTAELGTTKEGDDSFVQSLPETAAGLPTMRMEKKTPSKVDQAIESGSFGRAKAQKRQGRNATAEPAGPEASPAGKESQRSKKKTAKLIVQSSRRQRAKAVEAQNGWATEDATDIQEGADFDFEANLSKFNKHQIFQELRAEDTVALSSRLVGHNRLAPKPGTAGGKNLHWTENVLDSPQPFVNGVWDSEKEASGHELSDDFISSSGRNSKRAFEKSGVRKLSARSLSGRAEHTVVDPSSRVSARNTVRQTSIDVPGSPRSKSTTSMARSPFRGSQGPKPVLTLVETGRICPCLSPLQMLELEQSATNSMGLGDYVLVENAGRSIAEAVANTLASDGQGRVQRHLHVVIAVGNHRTGVRALAAGRHLRNRGFKVTATVMGLEREDDLLEEIKAQAAAYRKAGGYLSKPVELLETMKSGGLYPAVVVDALLGVHLVFDDLRTDDQAWYFEFVAHVNQADASSIAVDVPSGVDATSGQAITVQGQSLALLPYAVVWLGAARPWMQSAFRDERLALIPHLLVADIGVPNASWKRLGNRRYRGIDFGTSWVAPVKAQEGID